MPIARVWHTGLKAGAGEAYERFARDISLAMFRGQPGFLGCMMARSDESGWVLTIWKDRASADALEHSASYRSTVARILETGFLSEPQFVEFGNLHLADIAGLPQIV